MATTTNVPSSNFEDLQRDVQDATRFSNSLTIYENRVGKTIRPIPVVSDEIESNASSVSNATTTALSSISSNSASVSSAASNALTTDIPNAINSLGLQYPPITYTSGLTLDSYTKTYEQGGSIYLWGGALGTTATGAFDESGWQPLQGDLQLRRDVALFDTLSELIANTYDYGAGKTVKVNGESTVGDGGDGIWTSQATAGLTPNQTPLDRGSWEMVDGAGRLWLFSPSIPRVVSPKSFGSFNDGATDDSPAVQIANDYLASVGGGIVSMNQNQWCMSGVETLSDGIKFVGLGRYNTNIKYIGDNVSSVATFNFGQAKTGSGSLIPVQGCGVIGLTIDGNRAGGAVGNGIRVAVFDNLLLEDVETKDCAQGYGFGIIGTGASPRQNLFVRRCAAFRCGADGMDVKAGLNHISIIDFESAGHFDETGGDSIGLDCRGQYVNIINPIVYDCPEFGLRVRINAGEEDGDGDWNTTENARVNVVNPICYNNRDNIILSADTGAVINCTNLISRGASRYGLSTEGGGKVKIVGGSITESLTGMLPAADIQMEMIGFSIDSNTQDGLSISNSENIKMIGGSVSNNGRYGIVQNGTPANAVWNFDSVDISGNLTNYVNLGAASDGKVRLTNCNITNATSRGIQVAEAPFRLVISGGDISGNATNIHSINANSKITDVEGLVTRNKGSESFSVESLGVITVVVSHGMSFTPSQKDFKFSLGRNTNVGDYEVGFIRVAGISSTIANVEIDISQASATAGAVANLLWECRVKDI